MTSPIHAIPGGSSSAAVPALGAASAAKTAVDPHLKKVAEEFEQAFLRKILEAAHFGGKDGDHGYGGMAVEALASGLAHAGGMGLARQIEHALSRQHESTLTVKGPKAT